MRPYGRFYFAFFKKYLIIICVSFMCRNMFNYIRPAIFFSILSGLVLGVLLSIPVIQIFIVFLFFALGGIITILLKRSRFIEIPEIKDGIIIGCISGFVSVIAASVSFLICAAILSSIFSGMYSMVTAFFTSVSYFIVLLLLVFCIGIINAIFNAGSALLVVSLYNGESLQKYKKFELERNKDEKSINS